MRKENLVEEIHALIHKIQVEENFIRVRVAKIAFHSKASYTFPINLKKHPRRILGIILYGMHNFLDTYNAIMTGSTSCGMFFFLEPPIYV